MNEVRVTKDYKVGGHLFSVNMGEDDLKLMANYFPFEVSNICITNNKTFKISIETGNHVIYSEEMRQNDNGQTIICGKTSEGFPVFEFQWGEKTGGWLVCSDSYQKGQLITTGICKKATIDNALMVMYALSTADKKTVLFHASVVSHRDKGYMFLGRSGTGKSTHAQLWQQYIEGTELVNDDNPVVRINSDGKAIVYGSPWSGKTPCYRNNSNLLGGIVVLSQASHNKMSRLSSIKAYAVLVASISGMRWDKKIADGLHLTECELTETVPIWQLQCLPDREAAELCESIVTSVYKDNPTKQ